ncbi:MAG: alpha-amylase family protein [Thermoleophilia bacterium]
MDVPITSDQWWKNAIFYCLDVETYCDSNGDGVGDLRGLIQRLDHIDALGVTCIWLMPLMPSANRDDGYDVLDHYAVDPRLGSFGDLVDLLREARERGLRVIVDLVLNHTSDQHPWFQRSRSDPGSRERHYYVWKDEPQDWPDEVSFPGEEESSWEYDHVAELWYLHRFYRFQPDLDIGCPELREEMRRIVGFWLELGASGFRLDALPYVLEAADGDPAKEAHGYLRHLRSFLSRRSAGAIFLGEVNLPPEEQRRFFGDEDGDEAHLLTAFDQNNALFLALARDSAAPLAAELRRLPTIPAGCQWATFVRNHDELSLTRISAAERDEVLDRFAPEQRMRIYGRGLRRRLPSMLDGDEAWLRCVYSLLLALPGAPILYYGEEIGMAEDLDAPGRLTVRTPMQWSGGENAGFRRRPRRSSSVPSSRGASAPGA